MPDTRTRPLTTRHVHTNMNAWDDIAADRRRWFDQRGYGADFFRGGGSMLTRAETEALGEVRGRRVLHLQCASGEDTLSVANLGAAASIGLDNSTNQIEQARHKAQEARITNATFDIADVQKLPRRYRDASFDRILVTIGSLVWLDDFDGWAAGVADALAPGGRIVVSEEHPFQYVFRLSQGRLVLAHSYFDREPHDDRGWGHFPSDKKGRLKANHSWTIGDVVSALGRHGVATVEMREYPGSDPAIFVGGAPEWNRFQHIEPEDPGKLPVSLLLIAEKAQR